MATGNRPGARKSGSHSQAYQGRIQNFAKGGLGYNGNGIYCVQHNEHAKHARGVWGHAPQENSKN